jgi:hypothetical protein
MIKFEEGKYYIHGYGQSGTIYKIMNGMWFFKAGDKWLKRWTLPSIGLQDKFTVHLRELSPVMVEMMEDEND